MISWPISPPATLSAWMTSPSLLGTGHVPRGFQGSLYQPHFIPLPSQSWSFQSNTNSSFSLTSQQACSFSVSCLHLITP